MLVEVLPERVEPACPVLAIRLEPCVELEQGRWVQAIDPPLGAHPRRDQACFSQHLQVLGYARLAQGEPLDDVADAALFGAQKIEDAPAIRLGDGIERREAHELI